MLAVLSARLGVGGRYRPYPPSIPVERRYFTLMFVRASTVEVQDSIRQVCYCACILKGYPAGCWLEVPKASQKLRRGLHGRMCCTVSAHA